MKPHPTHQNHLTGPFDIIGDVHGCLDELTELLTQLGYQDAQPPSGRTAVFVGDLVDRGPDSPGVLRLVMKMAAAGHALCVPGNHDNKLARFLKGRNVQLTYGLDKTVDQLASEPDQFKADVLKYLDGLAHHLVLDNGGLVVAHGGLREEHHGVDTGHVRALCLYGETTGETDQFGWPVRINWAREYTGKAAVVYGHTPLPETDWLNGTINIDTGCAFGGRLTAVRYPERDLFSVEARRMYHEPARPLLGSDERPGQG